MEYVGEHLLPGQLGHLFVILSLVAAMLACFAWYRSASVKDVAAQQNWKRLARISFGIHTVSVISVFVLLCIIVSSHYFEYKYAWQHSSRSLEMKYLLSSIWEGQEGSFLLWSVWHAILGTVLMFTARKWEAGVMSVISFAQFCLATMILGIYFFDIRIGSDPFQLMRDSGILDDAPALHINMDISQGLRPDYLSFIKDGNDLNPLLQNYWMVIHPPVLFLGFAACIIPFAFAIAGLWKRDHTWVKPALPWSVFAAATLGTGIMMGGIWAYESLTFGGYWAWDPVENAVLVPWLVLIAGVHTLLVFRHTGHSLRTTYLFFILSFLFIIYSTYLTRSGDLQDTSVHAFTGDGEHVRTHLQIFLFIFVIPSLLLFFLRYKKIPYLVKEEQASSREFWMFIGSLVFFFAALYIIVFTSLPVINNIFGTGFTNPEDVEFAYNRIMIFVAIVIGLLTAISQYLRYKHTPKGVFWKKILWPTAATLVIGGLILAFGNIDYRKYGIGYLGAIWLALLSTIYTIVANASYIWLGMKGNLKLSGGSIAHLGFGLMLLGILISSSKKEILSNNVNGIPAPLAEGENPMENLTLVKGQKMDMGSYWVTYESDSVHPAKPLWYYNIRFVPKSGEREFILSPNAFVNYKDNEGLMANPDAKHYLSHDVFTYITSIPDPEKNKDTSSFKTMTVSVGDTSFYGNGFFVLRSIEAKDSLPFENLSADARAWVADIQVFSKTESRYISRPILIRTGGQFYPSADTVVAENLILRLDAVDGEKVELGIKEPDTILEYVTLKAYKFPYINLLWAGTIIMVIGMAVSMVRRISLNRATAG